MKSQVIGKDSDAGKDLGQEEKASIEDEMVGWSHWLNGHDLSKLWEVVKDGEPGMMQSMGSEKVGNKLGPELQTQAGPMGTTWVTSSNTKISYFPCCLTILIYKQVYNYIYHMEECSVVRCFW